MKTGKRKVILVVLVVLSIVTTASATTLTAASDQMAYFRNTGAVATGSIAAIKSPQISRELIRHGAHVQCVMSEGAQQIIHPYSMEYATGNNVITKISGFTVAWVVR